ncbi:NAD(P)H quinone oxidoreductase [Candidatus Filomicrobium marinum]|uniref:NAD(P)H quinone oxidoreductase n=1 Tax=Candidatus Filomicrobium marinum TaxID=1608628 RepID=A0A0D6J9W3_9HYPH|nr:NAD(P)H-quinone oxidoreductase [Candidatus Filomicrobium marinum]CFW99674.1 NAD(P)H quinone oxidoreductase [Candidatus Filomicrobium marinum]CPR15092.1 NAD(P)H quinone oxidoreductase [Candidatus Filomicrobium marinum]
MTGIPQSMNFINCSDKGGPEVLKLDSMPTPEPGPGQVLIKVEAAGVNRPDLLQRQGLYPAPKGHSETLGLEAAGTVVALGPNTHHFKPGDKVMALLNGGGYAQYCLAEEATCLPIPDGLPMIQAAAVPETFFTVWHNVFERGGLKAGEWFMIHGGTSGIGVTAIQLAKAFGAKVIATAGSDSKCQVCRELGADAAVNYKMDDFVSVVKTVTDKRGVDVILDMVGGDYIAKNIASLGDDGRLVNIAYQKGSKAEVDFMRVMLKRLTITGSTLRIRPTDVKSRIARSLEQNVLPLLADGSIKVVMDSTFPLNEASKAHARLDQGEHIGKVVLTV